MYYFQHRLGCVNSCGRLIPHPKATSYILALQLAIVPRTVWFIGIHIALTRGTCQNVIRKLHVPDPSNSLRKRSVGPVRLLWICSCFVKADAFLLQIELSTTCSQSCGYCLRTNRVRIEHYVLQFVALYDPRILDQLINICTYLQRQVSFSCGGKSRGPCEEGLKSTKDRPLFCLLCFSFFFPISPPFYERALGSTERMHSPNETRRSIRRQQWVCITFLPPD